MNQQQLFSMLPGLQPEEMMVLSELMKDMNEQEQQQFIMLYQGKRKEQQTMLIFTIIGFFGVEGIQRFVIGEVVMGIVYLLTVGFCGIGTIIDIVNIKSMTNDFNRKQAIECAGMMNMMKGRGF
ncbi:MAG: TM2 domain-containing protein [Flavisolibacter sp.]